MVLEALNDYLLALRFMLEGGGPADLGLPMRVAALCAEPEQRSETKAVVDRALALERELWSGEPAPSLNGARALTTPAETAVAIEDLTRAILKDAACGHLGKRPARDRRRDPARRRARRGRGRGRAAWRLRGMGSAGRGRRPEKEEDDLEASADDDDSEETRDDPRRSRGGARRASGRPSSEPASEAPGEPGWAALDGRLRRVAEGREVRDDDEAMQVPEPAGRITIQSRPEPEEDHVSASSQTRHEERQRIDMDAGERIHDRFNELSTAPGQSAEGGRPRRLSFPASRDDRVGRARGEL